MSKQTTFYEHFQIDDVLKFISGQLFIARSPEGQQLLLHELKQRDRLPVNFREYLLGLRHSHLVPIAEIYEDEQSAVIVHHALSSEPLTLLVTAKRPFHYLKALHLFQQLLEITIELSQRPIPIVTILDPRNIVMEGSKPILLYYDLQLADRKIHHEEVWRGLLYYLVTGIQSEDRPYPWRHELKLGEQVPKEVQKLIYDCVDPTITIEEILKRVQQIDVQVPQSKTSSRRRKLLGRVAAVGVGASLAIGYFTLNPYLGNQGRHVAQVSPKPVLPAGAQLVAISPIPPFAAGGSYLVKNGENLITLQGPTHVRFKFQQSQFDQFSAMFLTDGLSEQYGISLDTNRFNIVGEQQGQPDGIPSLPSERKSNFFQFNPTHIYQVDLVMIPEERLRIAVTDLDSDRVWKTAGPMMKDQVYRFRFRGNQSTHLQAVTFTHYKKKEDALQVWNNGQAWDLADGEAISLYGDLWIEPQAKWQINQQGKLAFQFQYSSKLPTNAMGLEVDTTTGDTLNINWSKNNMLTVTDENFKPLAVQNVGSGWSMTTPITCRVSSTGNLVQVELQQDNRKATVQVHYDHSVWIAQGILAAEEEMKVNLTK